MWLSNSSVGRKFIMAVTGAVLVLFVTFHCLMNAVAICWPAAYNSVCLFLGANWYALIASAGLAAFIVVHIIYAVMLTLQNRRARGHERYAVSHRPKSVEWSSQNMLVLGIVILAFLVVHMIQFWAKMQLVEIMGTHTMIPASAGTLFLQEAFLPPLDSDRLHHRLHRPLVPPQPRYLVNVPVSGLGQHGMDSAS